MTLDLASSLDGIRGIGPVRRRQLAEIGVTDVGGLLAHLPSRYEDRRKVATAASIVDEGDYTVEGRLRDVRLVLRRGRRFSLVRGTFEDATGRLPVAWFNRPYLPRQIDAAEEYLLHGAVRRRPGGLELQNPSCERLASAVHTGRVVPVYGALGPLGPALVRRVMNDLVATMDLAAGIADPLPSPLLEARRLTPLGPALQTLHRPDGNVDLEELNARTGSAHRRLVYGELLALQLRVTAARVRAGRRTKPHPVPRDPRVDRVISETLPFELTAAQRRVVDEVLGDLASGHVMRRLVQGDVGSGKTAVAVAALVALIESGLQAAFMAPTELLAEQHHATLHRLLGGRYRVALLTGSSPSAGEVRNDLRAGAVDLVVGTHALIQEGVEFHRLGLAVIDEQHRFGVAQRDLLRRKGRYADVLVMTATPIPRTLTLTVYGDLELSVIDELPPGRSPVVTRVVERERRAEVHERLRRAVQGGGRAYVVFPTIRANAERPGRSLEEGDAELRERLPELRFGVIHGQTPVEERLRELDRFATGDLRVLLSTTVIEVGVDVPAATLMVIEGAESFGLAQLHQLRGRVGRGAAPSECVAVHGELTPEAARRLEVFASTSDGFEIAEEDLRIRGPGELLGRRQAGAPVLRLADLRRDVDLLEAAREDALRLAGESDIDELLRLADALDGGGASRPRLVTS